VALTIVPNGKTLYYGNQVIKAGKEVPSHIKITFDESYIPPPSLPPIEEPEEPGE